MKIIFVNYSVGGYAGDSVSMTTIVKGLESKGHEVIIVTTDGDGYFYDKIRSKMYAPIRKKLLSANGNIIKIDEMSVYPIHCVSNRFGMYCPSATKEAKKIVSGGKVITTPPYAAHIFLGLENSIIFEASGGKKKSITYQPYREQIRNL